MKKDTKSSIAPYHSYITAAESDDSLQISPLMVWAGTQLKPNKRARVLRESKYNKIRDGLAEGFDPSNFGSREEAQSHLEEKVYGIGVIEFFLLKALIAWIIGKILDYYFLED